MYQVKVFHDPPEWSSHWVHLESREDALLEAESENARRDLRTTVVNVDSGELVAEWFPRSSEEDDMTVSTALTRKGWDQRVAAGRVQSGDSAWIPDAVFREAFLDPVVSAVSRTYVSSGLSAVVQVRIGDEWSGRRMSFGGRSNFPYTWTV